MKHIITKLSMAAVIIGLLCSNGWATDFASMSTEELAALRGTLQNVSPEEHDAFRAEWRSRLESMSAEERQKFLGHPPGNTNYQSGPRYKEQVGAGPHGGEGPGYGYGQDGVDGGQGVGGPGSGYGGGSGAGRGGGGGRK